MSKPAFDLSKTSSVINLPTKTTGLCNKISITEVSDVILLVFAARKECNEESIISWYSVGRLQSGRLRIY